MIAILQQNQQRLAEICRRRQVSHLAVFGSAASGTFTPGVSDIDLLVDFLPMPPREHADCYFGLIEDLQLLLNAQVDLVEEKPITNPFFREAVEETRILLYAAA